MVEVNMLFPNPDDPLAWLPPKVKTVGNITTGHICRAAYKKLKVLPHDVPVTIPCYMDKNGR